MRRLALAAGLALGLAAFGAQAAERLVDARQVFGFLSAYQSLTPAERSLFTMGYALRQGGKPVAAEVTLVEADGKRTPLPVDAEGRFTRLPTAAQMAGKPQVGVDDSIGKVAVSMLVESTAKPAAEMPVAQFAPALAQVNTGVTSKLGMLASLVPKVNRVTFVGAPSGKAVMTDGREVDLPMAKEGPTFDPVALKGARAVRFPKAPTHIRFEADK